MTTINSNELYAILRDLSNGNKTVGDAHGQITEMTKAEMKYEAENEPTETEVAFMIDQENNKELTSDEITSKAYVNEVVDNDEVPQPDFEEDTNRDAKVDNPSEPVPEPETDEKAEEKPAYKNKRTERTVSKDDVK